MHLLFTRYWNYIDCILIDGDDGMPDAVATPECLGDVKMGDSPSADATNADDSNNRLSRVARFQYLAVQLSDAFTQFRQLSQPDALSTIKQHSDSVEEFLDVIRWTIRVSSSQARPFDGLEKCEGDAMETAIVKAEALISDIDKEWKSESHARNEQQELEEAINGLVKLINEWVQKPRPTPRVNEQPRPGHSSKHRHTEVDS